MTIVVDANVAIAVLDSRHPFHRVAIRRCLTADGVAILNMTRAEALVHPSRLQQLDEADEVLDQLGFRTEPLPTMLPTKPEHCVLPTVTGASRWSMRLSSPRAWCMGTRL